VAVVNHHTKSPCQALTVYRKLSSVKAGLVYVTGSAAGLLDLLTTKCLITAVVHPNLQL
jgi:hypothetical protein